MSDSRCSKLILSRARSIHLPDFSHSNKLFPTIEKFLLERRIDGEHWRRLNGIVFCASRRHQQVWAFFSSSSSSFYSTRSRRKPPWAINNYFLFTPLKRWILMMVTLNKFICDWVRSCSAEPSRCFVSIDLWAVCKCAIVFLLSVLLG